MYILYRKSQKEMLQIEMEKERLANTFIDVETSRLQLGWMKRCVVSIFKSLLYYLVVIDYLVF